MIYLFDANFMLILFHEQARVPRDKSGKVVVERAQDRIDYLVQTISKQRAKIVIPTPALAEFILIASDRSADYLQVIRRRAVFEVAGFDDPEVLALVEYCLSVGKVKAKQPCVETWAKVKYDQQIAAIAKTKRVNAIYSTDGDLHKAAKRMKIDSYNLKDLPLPPPKQMALTEAAGAMTEAKDEPRPATGGPQGA